MRSDPHRGALGVDAWRAALGTEQTLRRRPDATDLLAAPEQAVGRILADDVQAPEDVPAMPLAAMDGFAVRRSDLDASGTTRLPVTADLAAQPGQPSPLQPGSAARIMTGAPVPAGADAVIEVEATDADPVGPCPHEVTIRLDQLPAPGRHVRGIGEEVASGQTMACAGERVTAGLVGLALQLGLTTLPVLAAPRVGVVVTGDELAAPGEQIRAGTVRESNGAMLAAALSCAGAVTRIERCGDDPAALRALLEELAEQSDLVLTTGGIGYGAYDVVKVALGPRGTGTSTFEHLALRPGGPQGRGHLSGGVPVVHLPGTPVGAYVGFHLFVRPLLDPSAPQILPAAAPLNSVAPRSRRHGTLVRAARTLPGEHDDQGRPLLEILPGHRLAPYGRADALLLTDIGDDGVEHTRMLSLR